VGETKLIEQESEIFVSNSTIKTETPKVKAPKQQKASGNMMLSFLEDNGLLIAFITALAYVSSYAYEKGYEGYYGLTDIFNPEISVSTIAATLTEFGPSLLVLCAIYSGLKSSFPDDSKNIYIRYIGKEMTSPFLIFLVFYSLYHDTPLLLKLSLSILLIYIFLPLLVCFIFRKGLKGIKKHIAERANRKTISLERGVKLINSHVSLKIMSPTLLILSCSYFPLLLGETKAFKQESYFVIRNEFPNMVVIKESKETLIVAPVDLDKKIITPRYRVIESKSNLDKPLVLEKIKIKGGLKIKEPLEK